VTPATLSPAVQSLSAVGAVQSAPTQATVVTVLLLALIAKVVLQGAIRRPLRGALRVLNVVIAPLLVVFVIIVLQRFHDLSY
jgi:threonine/homoserine/homoserine lactone efflux protein